MLPEGRGRRGAISVISWTGVAGFLSRLRRLLPALWLGLLATIALVAAPVAFAALPVHDAGRVAARLLAIEADASLAFAVVLVLIERRRAREAAAAGRGSLISAEMLLLFGTLACTVAGYFALLPLMDAARAGQGRLSFAALHGVSSALYALKALLVLVLAWRATKPLG
jgi:hypothetical protein